MHHARADARADLRAVAWLGCRRCSAGVGKFLQPGGALASRSTATPIARGSAAARAARCSTPSPSTRSVRGRADALGRPRLPAAIAGNDVTLLGGRRAARAAGYSCWPAATHAVRLRRPTRRSCRASRSSACASARARTSASPRRARRAGRQRVEDVWAANNRGATQPPALIDTSPRSRPTSSPRTRCSERPRVFTLRLPGLPRLPERRRHRRRRRGRAAAVAVGGLHPELSSPPACARYSGRSSSTFRRGVGRRIPGQRASAQLSYRWTCAGGASSFSVDPRYFKVSAFTFNASTEYDVTAVVTDAMGRNNTASTVVVVGLSPLVATIDGGDRNLGYTETLTLDASPSLDPDTGGGAGLSLAWACEVSGGGACSSTLAPSSSCRCRPLASAASASRSSSRGSRRPAPLGGVRDREIVPSRRRAATVR